MIADKQRAAAPGWTATSKAVRPKVSENAPGRNAVFMCGNGKVTEFSPTSQLSLFDSEGNAAAAAAAAANEMAFFFDAVREHLEGLKPGDRLSVLSCLYWAKAGQDRETLSGLLRKPLRPIFDTIAKEVLP
jgi:hypothetical protein